MKGINAVTIIIIVLFAISCKTSPERKSNEFNNNEISILVTNRYLNFPISHKVQKDQIRFEIEGKTDHNFLIRLAPSNPDYWVFFDASKYIGKVLKINYMGNPEGLNKIYQDDVINGYDSLYKEINRPRVHFSSRRGWNNDPNGLIFFEGEYHLFYQHNPFEREWGNMSWGHAISKDLIHWEELPVVMYPDSLGSIFSGSAVIDYNNTSGFGKDGTPAMIAIYTVDNPEDEKQCIAYSLDKGRTFEKYKGNPVLESKARWNSKDLRDPHVFWYEPDKIWVMVLYERDGNSIYNSVDLKKWEYKSHINGFFECPQLFELPVDGNLKNKKWIMYGASGTYMLGGFNGQVFTPESGKYYYGNGALYAAQTFNNIPNTDGRRIQIGWGRIVHPGMPFRHMMLLPTELSLRTTKEGIRMFNAPIKEIDILQGDTTFWQSLNAVKATENLQQFNNSESLRIKFKLHLLHSTDAGLNLFGQTLFRYDMNYNQINGLFYTPEDRTSMEISADIIIDKTSIEVFVDNGFFSYAIERKAVSDNKVGFKFFGNNIEVKNLTVYPMKSIWNN